jgi:hypothetical protein
MATNANDKYKFFKYYEGLCSSKDFPKEIAKVLALGVKSKTQKDIDGNVTLDPQILKVKNWDIVYPAPDETIAATPENGLDAPLILSYSSYVNYFNGSDEKDDIFSGLSPAQYKAKILNQIDKITDTVILRTTTSAKTIDAEDYDDLTVDPTSNSSDLTMYLEIFKPTYVADPEQYPLDCERQGLIPQLITRDMHENSYKTQFATEDAIYLDKICKEKADSKILDGGAIRITDDEYDTYATQLTTLGYQAPTFTQPGSLDVVLGASAIAKIKQENAILYNYILNNIDIGGIEPKMYNRLEEVTMTFYRSVDASSTTGGEYYSLKIAGKIPTLEYTIAQGAKYKLEYTANCDITPEFYVDGIYIPLDPEKYYVEDNTITFDDNIKFEASEDGVLVVRYTYSKTGDSIIFDRTTMLNNHYVLMRMFDNINETASGPAENVYNGAGEIIQVNSHISPWSKLSWYRDFEEVLVDTLDEDISTTSMQDGTLFVPLETPGLNADTKMRYWINTNNDRFSLIVMGNPSLDYTKDRHLVSACYCGAIDSFDNSINDTAGNFALFTSSSTEPCNTILTTVKEQDDLPTFVFDSPKPYGPDIQSFMDACIVDADYVSGQAEYSLQLGNQTYFDKNIIPQYMVLDDSNNALTGLKMRKTISNWDGENGKFDSVKIVLNDEDVSIAGAVKIYFLFGHYKEKNVITSGITRDLFGNVLDVDKVNSYGKNTSDGVTSIMMFHTRSKAYYQKHHMLFATTEEYMSKVMYGKSSYTGEYYADRIKVTHGNDGPRGTLSDLLVIDSCSLYALDELVINKDFAKDPDEFEETFVFFPITAPFSPLSDSPNARYGLAIKKAEVEPTYEDEVKILKIAISELDGLADSLWSAVDKNIVPPETTANGCSVYWRVLKETAWAGTPDKASDYVPIKLVVTNSSQYQGDLDENPITADSATITAGTKVSDGTKAYIKVTGFTANSGETMYYGIADEPINKLGGPAKDASGKPIEGTSAQLKAVLFDGAIDDKSDDNAGGWVYGIEGVPYTSEMTTDDAGNTVILDASPDKFLMLYSAKDSVSDTGEHRCSISKFACVPLTEGSDANALLQYPKTVSAVSVGGQGRISRANDGEGSASLNFTVPYDTSSLTLYLYPDKDLGFTGAPVVSIEDETGTTTGTVTQEGTTYKVVIAALKNNVQVKVTFN